MSRSPRAPSAPNRTGTRRVHAAVPDRKPIAMARRVSLFDRRVEIRLAPAAYDILFDVAAVLSEGQVEDDRFVGSTMVTVDLDRAASRISDECDAATVR